MLVEETPNSTITDDQISTSGINPNPKVHDSDDDELEEGEIIGEDDSTTLKASSATMRQPHPLENSWTFCYDNPSAKSKQAAPKLKDQDFKNIHPFTDRR
ncbi:hypothetical protein QN277_009422 [Acacia crassicarpa]|uniref:Uncharacterized protein n=1 Tax=Acacia crassicarpa TaxID=499986 RepID=A0AAE1JIU5_9FABA|nr:hypothetical protein QN277_009422 [Acacia crassicarpa]